MDPNNNTAGMPGPQGQPVPMEPIAPAEPNPVVQALAEEPATPAPASAPMGAPVKKSGKGMLYGMIIFAILAIGGIGFGVYMMMDGNNKVASLEKQISDLRKQNSDLLDKLAELESEEEEVEEEIEEEAEEEVEEEVEEETETEEEPEETEEEE